MAQVHQRRSTRNAGTRRDPPPRRVDRQARLGTFRNLDPDRHYVGVYKAGDPGIGHYKELGYKVEYVTASGPRSIGQDVDGEGIGPQTPVEYRGHVLMSISNEDHAELEAHGTEGDNGQIAADELEDRILDRSKGTDLLRGINVQGRDRSRFVDVENKIEAPEAELGT